MTQQENANSEISKEALQKSPLARQAERLEAENAKMKQDNEELERYMKALENNKELKDARKDTQKSILKAGGNMGGLDLNYIMQNKKVVIGILVLAAIVFMMVKGC